MQKVNPRTNSTFGAMLDSAANALPRVDHRPIPNTMRLSNASFVTRIAASIVIAGIAAPRLSAQASIVVPRTLAKTEGNRTAAVPHVWWTPTGSRYQQVVRASSIAPNVATIRSLAFRRDNDVPFHFASRPLPAMRLELGTAKTSPNTMAMRFAANRGNDLAVHFSGSVQLPQALHAGAGPSPFHVKIPLGRPYTHVVKRGNILMEMRFAATRARTDMWMFDAHVEPGQGSVRWFGQTGTRGTILEAWRAYLITGGRLDLAARGNAIGAPAIVMVGASRTSFGTLRLPLDLTALGAAGSSLYVSPDFVLSPLRSSQELRLSIRIPPDDTLAGTTMYAQYAFFPRRANAAGLVTSQAAAMTIGRAPRYDSTAIVAGGASPTTGVFCVDPRLGGAPVLELHGSFR